MLGERIELSWGRPHWFLRPARIPIPPSQQMFFWNMKVELRRIEPLTSCMPCKRSPSWATAPFYINVSLERNGVVLTTSMCITEMSGQPQNVKSREANISSPLVFVNQTKPHNLDADLLFILILHRVLMPQLTAGCVHIFASRCSDGGMNTEFL